MKFWKLFVFAALPLLALEAAPQFAPRPISPRSYKEAQGKVTLIENGKVRFLLYVPRNTNKTIRAAAAELSSLLSEISGTAVKTVSKLPADKTMTVIRLGDPSFAAVSGIDLKKLDRDGYVITAKGNQILIAGGDALEADFGLGTLFGGYEFLERFAGARFYFPGKLGTLLPRKKNWQVPAMTLYDRPDNQYRKIYWKGLDYGGRFWFDTDVSQKTGEALQQNRLRHSTLLMPNCHGLAYLNYVKRFAKSNPEYFAVKPDGNRADGSLVRVPSDAMGQLCFSSNIMEEIYQDAKAILSGPKAVEKRKIKGLYSRWSHTHTFFNLMPNDSMARCRCEKCIRIFVPNKGYTQKGADFLWKKLLAVPNRLKKENVPGFVTMMAYDLCRYVPEEPIPDNVVMQVALTGPWKERKTEEQKKDDDNLKAWVKKINSKVYLWNYATKLTVRHVPAVPNFTPKAVGRYYKKVAPYIFGTFLEAESDCWFFGHLNFYVFSKVMWNTQTDVDALLDEYRERMFGKGAAPMKEIMDILEEKWLARIIGNTVETDIGPVTTPPSEYKLWHTIYSPKDIKYINALFDKAAKLASADKSAVERIKIVRKSLWGPLVKASGDYFRKASAVDMWRTPVKLLNANEKVLIDGKGDDAVWKDAPSIALLPLQKNEVEVHTFVKLMADKENFYFLFDCREPLTAKMRQTKRPFDDVNMWEDNAVEIHLDPAGKRQQAFQIMVDSHGSVADLKYTPGKLACDWKWNSKAQAKSSVIPGKGWFVEVKVPRKSLGALKNTPIVANFNRHRTINGMKVHPYYTWSPYARLFGDLPNFGVIYPGELPEKNLYTDDDFKVTGIKRGVGSSWINWGPMPARDEKIFRTAGVSIRLEGPGKRNAILHKLSTLKPNTTYRLSFFIRQENVKLLPGKGPQGGGFYIRIDDGNGVVRYFPQHSFFGSIPWTRWEYTFKTGPKKLGTNNSVYHHYILRNASGKVWLDHMELVEVPSKK